MTTRIFVLLGGLWGADGAVDSRGMLALAGRLKEFGSVEAHYWSEIDGGMLHPKIKTLPANDKLIFIGFSGGGSRATMESGALHPREIDLLVAYDPSPWWQMVPLRGNVRRALCYHNKSPLMFGLGGGAMTGAAEHIDNVDVSEQHLAVQYDERLHQMTIAAVQKAALV